MSSSRQRLASVHLTFHRKKHTRKIMAQTEGKKMISGVFGKKHKLDNCKKKHNSKNVSENKHLSTPEPTQTLKHHLLTILSFFSTRVFFFLAGACTSLGGFKEMNHCGGPHRSQIAGSRPLLLSLVRAVARRPSQRRVRMAWPEGCGRCPLSSHTPLAHGGLV